VGGTHEIGEWDKLVLIADDALPVAIQADKHWIIWAYMLLGVIVFLFYFSLFESGNGRHR